MNSNKTILVTGGTGLVGSHLLFDLTKKGYYIRALIRKKASVEKVKTVFSFYSERADDLINKIQWIEGDLMELDTLEKAFENISVVYHCAAVVSFNSKNTFELLKTNIEGTENIVNLCLEKSIEKLCFVSSIAALGHSENGDPVTEKDLWIPSDNHSVYSISKFKSEMVVWRGVQEGLKAVIVNPSIILGPGQWNSGSSEIFSKANKGMLFYTLGKTGFVDVRDVVACMIQLTEQNISGERFIINAENRSYKEIFTEIASAFGKKKPRFNAGKKLLTLAFCIDSVLSFTGLKKQQITKSIIRSSLNSTIYSNNKIIETIGFQFTPIQETILFVVNKFNESQKARK